jgi:hypothetical protein
MRYLRTPVSSPRAGPSRARVELTYGSTRNIRTWPSARPDSARTSQQKLRLDSIATLARGHQREVRWIRDGVVCEDRRNPCWPSENCADFRSLETVPDCVNPSASYALEANPHDLSSVPQSTIFHDITENSTGNKHS